MYNVIERNYNIPEDDTRGKALFEMFCDINELRHHLVVDKIEVKIHHRGSSHEDVRCTGKNLKYILNPPNLSDLMGKERVDAFIVWIQLCFQKMVDDANPSIFISEDAIVEFLQEFKRLNNAIYTDTICVDDHDILLTLVNRKMSDMFIPFKIVRVDIPAGQGTETMNSVVYMIIPTSFATKRDLSKYLEEDNHE